VHTDEKLKSTVLVRFDHVASFIVNHGLPPDPDEHASEGKSHDACFSNLRHMVAKKSSGKVTP
jgi:hypothetical protein